LNYKILIINSKSKNSEESDEEVIKNLIGKLEGKLHLQKKTNSLVGSTSLCITKLPYKYNNENFFIKISFHEDKEQIFYMVRK